MWISGVRGLAAAELAGCVMAHHHRPRESELAGTGSKALRYNSRSNT